MDIKHILRDKMSFSIFCKFANKLIDDGMNDVAYNLTDLKETDKPEVHYAEFYNSDETMQIIIDNEEINMIGIDMTYAMECYSFLMTLIDKESNK